MFYFYDRCQTFPCGYNEIFLLFIYNKICIILIFEISFIFQVSIFDARGLYNYILVNYELMTPSFTIFFDELIFDMLAKLFENNHLF